MSNGRSILKSEDVETITVQKYNGSFVLISGRNQRRESQEGQPLFDQISANFNQKGTNISWSKPPMLIFCLGAWALVLTSLLLELIVHI